MYIYICEYPTDYFATLAEFKLELVTFFEVHRQCLYERLKKEGKRERKLVKEDSICTTCHAMNRCYQH